MATGHRNQPAHSSNESEPPVLVPFGGIDPDAPYAALVLLADWHGSEGYRRARKVVTR